MLNEVLEYLNNYFIEYTSGAKNYSYTKDVTFTTNDTLTATDFSDTYIIGEYILIEGTRINDGVYKVSDIDATTINIDTGVDYTIDAEPEVSTTLTKCYIPKDLLALVEEISTYNANVTDGLTSESQGQRTVNFANGSSGGSSGWQGAFASRLSKYRKMRW